MASTQLQQGDVIASRFRIVDRVGKGGMGAVYRAVQQPLGRTVALKVIQPQMLDSTEFVDRFEEEAKAIAGLRHPGIVTLYDFGPVDDGGLFLAMEFVDGISLQQHLDRNGKMSLDETTSVMFSLAAALAEAHQNEVVHRDIKPANVMLCDDDSYTFAKLVDFGLSCRLNAKECHRHTKTGEVMGTPGFIAPETALDGLQRDPRSDLYALGVLWFEMLTGQPPFRADTPVALLLKHTRESPPAPGDVNPDVQIPDEMTELIMELLSKDPDQRPQHAGEFVEALQQVAPRAVPSSIPTRELAKTLVSSPPNNAASLSNRQLLQRRDHPVVMVAPFSNLSADPSQEFFSDGLTEDLITALSKFRFLRVIARQTAFSLKEESESPEEIARDLEANYLLEGSVRKAGDRVRITARLVDVSTGHQLWGQRYDRTLEDIFAVQDDVTQAIVATIPRQVQDADMQHVQKKSSENMAAYELFLAGRKCHHVGTREANAEGIELLEQAVELDPDFAQAWAWLACIYGQAAIRGYTADRQATLDASEEALQRAYECDDQDSECHRLMCELRLLEQEWEQAKFHHERALSLNPNDPMLIAQRSFVMLCFGNPADGIPWIEEAMRLDPMHPTGYQDHLGRLYFAARRYEEAVETLSKPTAPTAKALGFLAGSLARLGRSEEATEVVEKIHELDDTLTAQIHVEMVPYRFTADREHHLESLQLAGL